MKKYIAFASGLLAIVSLAYAQSGEGLRLTPGGISGVASSQEQSPSADSAQAQPSVVYPVPPRPSLDNIFVGFVQFNNLVVESISNKIPECPGNALQTPCTYSAEIIANYGYPVPMMDKMRGSMTPGGVTPEPVSSASAPQLKCYSFQSRDSAAGVSIDCPGRPSTAPSATPTTPPATAAPNSMPYPMPKYPPQYSYRIKISSDTRLSLRDRTPATLADFSAGDQINVFGFYNSDGSIQAFIVRDLSKPIERRFIQLENVELVSVSQTSAPADLVVVQRQIYPCYDYGFEGNIKRPFPCPMGVRFTQNLQTPISLIPIWDSLRKYVVKVDSQTMLLDRTKNRIDLSGLKIGDKLNIYGSVTGDGGTIDADIVRDLTQPAEARNLNGTITQVNADGSFVLQTESGEAFTVPNPIQVGATIKLKGLIDELQKLVTQISEMTIRNNSMPLPPTLFPRPIPPPSPEPVACTQEAKQCPDGSYVSRGGPNCDFTKCPEVNPSPTPTPKPNSTSYRENGTCPPGYVNYGIPLQCVTPEYMGYCQTHPCPICLAGSTLIDAPSGSMPVKDLQVGMSVWTTDKTGQRVSSVITKTSKVLVPPTHQMVHLVLNDGRELFASPGHSTIDGRTVGDLAPGDLYDGVSVVSTERVPYGDSATYDILPSGNTGFYWANGILIGSTLH